MGKSGAAMNRAAIVGVYLVVRQRVRSAPGQVKMSLVYRPSRAVTNTEIVIADIANAAALVSVVLVHGCFMRDYVLIFLVAVRADEIGFSVNIASASPRLPRSTSLSQKS